MPLRIVEISAPADNTTQLEELATKHKALDYWHTAKNRDGRRIVRILIGLADLQKLTDSVQRTMSGEDNWRIIIQPVEATIPTLAESSADESKGHKVVRGSVTREEIYNEVMTSTHIDSNFILLVILSTLVCAIGLITNNVAVVIGAMVIAPLLGPNLAMSLGVALGDRELITESLKTNLTGLGMTLGMAFVAGLVLPRFMEISYHSAEIIARTSAGYDSIILALASGAAAVLSLTSGLSSTLVGVMVAVALMPPAVTLGLMLGTGEFNLAFGAALLLAINISCVALASQIIYAFKGIKPRTWYMRKKTKQSLKLTVAFWISVLTLLSLMIAMRG